MSAYNPETARTAQAPGPDTQTIIGLLEGLGVSLLIPLLSVISGPTSDVHPGGVVGIIQRFAGDFLFCCRQDGQAQFFFGFCRKIRAIRSFSPHKIHSSLRSMIKHAQTAHELKPH